MREPWWPPEQLHESIFIAHIHFNELDALLLQSCRPRSLEGRRVVRVKIVECHHAHAVAMQTHREVVAHKASATGDKDRHTRPQRLARASHCRAACARYLHSFDGCSKACAARQHRSRDQHQQRGQQFDGKRAAHARTASWLSLTGAHRVHTRSRSARSAAQSAQYPDCALVLYSTGKSRGWC